MERILRRVGMGLAVLTIVAAALIIIGWQYRIPTLRGNLFGTFVAPNAALSFLLAGISILFQLSRWRALHKIGVALGALVAAFALATLAEYTFKIDLRIDRLFMAHRLDDWNLPLPGRYAFTTAIGFAFVGFSQMTLRSRSRWPVAEICGLGAVVVSYLGAIGYLYSIAVLFGRVAALHSIVLFAIVGTALMCTASQRALFAILFSPYAGSIASRRMILAILLLMPLFGLLRIEATPLMSAPFATALLVLVAATFFSILALHTGSVLNRIDQQRRESEEALLKSEKLAAAGRMAATVAHEVNNPLAAISNIVYLLQTASLPEQARRDYLQIAERELKRVTAIARRTLGFYRDHARPAEVMLDTLFDSVFQIHSRRLGQKNITFRKIGDSSLRIFCKEGEVRQALDNLVSNAIDALPDSGGVLELWGGASNGYVLIEVTDNGAGIETSNLDRIFEPFFTTKKELGTGLGLWVTRELVRNNGGAIRVVSTKHDDGHRTTFRITFPAAPAVHKPEQVRSAVDSPR